MPNEARVNLSLKSDVAAQIAATANQYKALDSAAQKAEQSAARYAKTLTQVALADAKTATEAQRLAVQTANASRAQTQAEAAALRLARAQTQAASGTSFATQTAQAFTSQIGAMVSPLALAAAGMGALVATANSFKEAFAFKAELDATTLSVNAQLRGVRESGEVWKQASVFAQQYKLTQEETTQAIAASIGVMRSSKAPVEDILGVLARLQVLSPEQSLQEAAIAVKALASGDTTSLVTRFEVGRDVANEMRKEIQGGADAVQVMAKFLDNTGIGMDVLATKTTGAMGAMKDLAKAQEDLALAQAQFAQGPGMLLLQTQTNLTRDAIKLLQGDLGQLNTILADSGVVTTSVLKPLTDYNTFVLDAGRNLLSWAGVLPSSSAELHTGAAATDAASAAAVAYAARVTAAGDAAIAASGKVRELNAAVAAGADARLPHLTDRSAQGGLGGGAGGALGGGVGTALIQGLRKGDQEAQRLQDARDALAFSRAKTSAQRIALLQQQQARTTDPVEKIRLQQQIEAERNSTAKGHTSTLAKQLTLHESIYDSIQKQRDAQLDIEELAIRDRMQDRDDAQKAKTARAILASSSANADLKGRAADTLALIDVQDRKRAAELASKGATAGGQIINGKLLQSVPGGVPAPFLPPGAAPVAGLPGALPAAGAAAPTGGGPLTINLVVDGKTLASVSEPYIMDTLLRAVRGARATAGA